MNIFPRHRLPGKRVARQRGDEQGRRRNGRFCFENKGEEKTSKGGGGFEVKPLRNCSGCGRGKLVKKKRGEKVRRGNSAKSMSHGRQTIGGGQAPKAHDSGRMDKGHRQSEKTKKHQGASERRPPVFLHRPGVHSCKVSDGKSALRQDAGKTVTSRIGAVSPSSRNRGSPEQGRTELYAKEERRILHQKQGPRKER